MRFFFPLTMLFLALVALLSIGLPTSEAMSKRSVNLELAPGWNVMTAEGEEGNEEGGKA